MHDIKGKILQIEEIESKELAEIAANTPMAYPPGLLEFTDYQLVPKWWIMTVMGSTQSAAKSIISIPEPLTLDWQTDLAPEGSQTYAQKHGNDLFAHSDWAYNPDTLKWFSFSGIQFEPTFDGDTLMSVSITSDIYPAKTIIG